VNTTVVERTTKARGHMTQLHLVAECRFIDEHRLETRVGL
jgi:hypothetical protein